VNEFSLGDGKSDPQVGHLPLDDAEMVLKSADVRTYGVRAERNDEVINI